MILIYHFSKVHLTVSTGLDTCPKVTPLLVTVTSGGALGFDWLTLFSTFVKHRIDRLY